LGGDEHKTYLTNMAFGILVSTCDQGDGQREDALAPRMLTACSAGLKSAVTSPTAGPYVRLGRIQPFGARQAGVACT
jgi:hypothetical protein